MREAVRAHVGGKVLELVQGDITQEETEAIVNAANSALRGGGGVDGAIHHAAGPAVMRELREKYSECPTGSAVVTGGGRLAADYILHAVGPRYRGREKDAELLADAYRACLNFCEELKIRSVAFPSISTGIYGYPLEEAAPIALSTVAGHLGRKEFPHLVRFVLFDETAFGAYESALQDLTKK